MLDHEDRDVRGKPVDRFDDLGGFIRRDAGGRLVEQEHLWLKRKPDCQIEQTLLTVSKVRHLPFGEMLTSLGEPPGTNEKLIARAMPDDPEFRSALVGYLEWGSRLAVINSQPGATVDADQPMPKWGWGEVKGPYSP